MSEAVVGGFLIFGAVALGIGVSVYSTLIVRRAASESRAGSSGSRSGSSIGAVRGGKGAVAQVVMIPGIPIERPKAFVPARSRDRRGTGFSLRL